MQPHRHTWNGGSRLIFGLFVVLAACQDQPMGPAIDRPEVFTPRFAPGTGQVVLVLEDLGPALGATLSSANAINNAKQITGWRTTAYASSVAYVWAPGTAVKDLGTLGQAPYTSVGNDINEAGVVVGKAGTHAFRWSAPGPMQQLPSQYSVTESAAAINDGGHAVGTVKTTVLSHPFRWLGGGSDYLPLPPPYTGYNAGGEAYDINNSHHIVGRGDAPGAADQAFFWRANNGYEPLAEPAGSSTSAAEAINDAGVIAGWSTVQGTPRALRWPHYTASPQDLGTLGGSWSLAYDVNESGVIVGAAASTSGQGRAFRLDPAGFPQGLIMPNGALSSVARGINDDGHIVGSATFAPRVVHAVVWWRYTGEYIYVVGGQWPAAVNLPGPDVFAVALLSTRELDALRIDVGTLTVGDDIGEDVRVLASADGTPAAEERDMNGDGMLDLVVSFDGEQIVRNELHGAGDTADLLLKGALTDRSMGVYARGTVAIER